jgi:hypothetical protein
MKAFITSMLGPRFSIPSSCLVSEPTTLALVTKSFALSARKASETNTQSGDHEDDFFLKSSQVRQYREYGQACQNA